MYVSCARDLSAQDFVDCSVRFHCYYLSEISSEEKGIHSDVCSNVQEYRSSDLAKLSSDVLFQAFIDMRPVLLENEFLEEKPKVLHSLNLQASTIPRILS